MKQTQGPQRFAFCTNQINIFNKAYSYQTAIQLYEKNLTIHTIFQMYKCYKIVCNPGSKNTIEIGKLSLKKKGNFAKKPEATDVGIVRLKAQSEKQLP